MLRMRELRANEIGAFLVVRHITAIATKYDYRDAQERIEMVREWYESDPEAEQVELPNIDRSIPDAMRKRPLGRAQSSAANGQH